MAKKKNNNDLLLGAAALGIGAYFLLFNKDTGGGGSEGGSFSAPLALYPSGEQANSPTMGTGGTGIGTSGIADTKKSMSIAMGGGVIPSLFSDIQPFTPGSAPHVQSTWAGIQAEQSSFLSSLPGQTNKPPTLAQATTTQGLIWKPTAATTKKTATIVSQNYRPQGGGNYSGGW